MITCQIKARLERTDIEGEVVIRITWETMAADMCEALSKARAYIKIAERNENAECNYMMVEAV